MTTDPIPAPDAGTAASGAPATGPDVDRLTRLAVRAFPPRWRREHGDELLELNAELRSERANHRLAEASGLVRGGWAVRLRNRPPLRTWLAYRMLERPLPVRWHDWMRDDLQGRWLGWRLTAIRVSPVSLIWIVTLAWSALRGDGLDTTLVGLLTAVMAAAVVANVSGWPARRLRRAMWTRSGYTEDGSHYLVPPPPDAGDLRVPVEFVAWGARRYALAPLVLPVGGWAIMAGLATMVGATAPDEPFRLGDLTARRDPSSPLDRPVVLAALAAALAVAALATLVAGHLASRRALAAPAVTIHGLNALPLPPAVFTALVWSTGLAFTGIGFAGVFADRVAVGCGAAGLVAGAVLVALALVARHHGARLGRPVTLGDLTVGERVVMLPVAVRGSTR